MARRGVQGHATPLPELSPAHTMLNCKTCGGPELTDPFDRRQDSQRRCPYEAVGECGVKKRGSAYGVELKV